MVARLVIDAIWRNRWAYAVVSAVLIPCWLMYVASGDNVFEISLTAFSLISAAVVGPMIAIPTMGVRELVHLPVTSRDRWRATWVVATVVPAGLLLATKMISALLVAAYDGRPKVTAEEMLLSAVYDFSWAGVVLPVLPWLGYAANAVAHRGTVMALLAATWTVMGLLACFALPILMSAALPTHLGEFTSVMAGALILGSAAAVGTLAWTPQRSGLVGERAQAAFAPRALRRAAPKLQRRRGGDRLTGISRVVVPHLLATFALPLAACLALASYGLISGSGPWWFLPRAPTVFDPADTGDRGLTFFVLLPSAVVIMQGLWTPWARLLKVLPLPVRQINALLLLTPFATWTMLWLCGWSAYTFVYGAPRTLGIEFAAGMAAVGALAHAALLRVQGSVAFVWILACIGGLMPQLVKVGLRDGTAPHVVFAVIGAIALSAAAVVNHHTLTHSTSSSRAYRRPQPPFGMPAKLSLP